MTNVETLPNGYVWIDEAFEQAWRKLEDADGLESKLLQVPDSSFSEAMNDGAWTQTDPHAQKAYDDSRRRTESVMRAALADGRLRAFISHHVTGEPRELSDRHEWANSSYMIANFDRTPDHLTCPGPDAGGRHVFVKSSELKALLQGQQPDTSQTRKAALVATMDHLNLLRTEYGKLPTRRIADEWRKRHAPRVSRDSLWALMKSNGASDKPGPKGPRTNRTA